MADNTITHERLPLFFNPGSGSSQESLRAIEDDTRIQMEPTRPEVMKQAIENAVENGHKRIAVSGGDGTIALAAAQIAGQKIELGVIPSGTLNHFAKRLGIPTDTKEALNTVLSGKARPVDVGYVNDKLFINTSSVGAYPTFVRSRNRLENRMHYLTASVIAGIRRLLKFQKIRVNIL
ncbi:MAG: diacylglycerol kinase family protein, partial [Desulfuromusa sp.]|nr:diacylglycerol kinase family protein [Desulfuromusa sp.]